LAQLIFTLKFTRVLPELLTADAQSHFHYSTRTDCLFHPQEIIPTSSKNTQLLDTMTDNEPKVEEDVMAGDDDGNDEV
jgi:hypothetical protein